MKRKYWPNRKCDTSLYIPLLIIGSGLFLPGCAKEETPIKPALTTPVTAAKIQQEESQQVDGKGASLHGLLKSASELINQTKSTGGNSTKTATKWMQDRLGDAADAGGATAEESMKWATSMYQSLKDQGLTTAGSAQEWVADDWKKMGAWEYKVLTVSESEQANIEQKLNELGSQRWECFHVSNSADGQTMYFKKQARSYLKNVPLKDMLKMIPLLGGSGE